MAGIYKRGKTYWARAQRKGRESLQTTDRTVAKRRFEQWKERLEALAFPSVKQFITQHFLTLKPKSARRYGVSLRWLNEKFENSFLDEINRQTLSEFEQKRREDGVSGSSIRRDLSCLSSLLAFCEDKDWIEEGKNLVPAYLRRRQKRGLKEGNPRTRYYSHDEEKRLLAAARSPLREAMMLACAKRKCSLSPGAKSTFSTIQFVPRETPRMAVPLPERSAQNLARWKTQNIGSLRSLYVFHKDNGNRFRTQCGTISGELRLADGSRTTT